MIHLQNHITDCIWLFVQACLGAVYLSLIVLLCITILAFTSKLANASRRRHGLKNE